MIAFAFLAAAATIYWPSSRALAGLWNDTEARTYTHGWLVLLICLWWIARARADLAAASVRPLPQAFAAVLMLSAAWLVFWRAGIQDLHLMVLPVLLLASWLAIFGWRATRALVFPIAFVYFALPLWGELVGVLQFLSVRANEVLIWLTGLPAYIDGRLVHVPAGTFEVADGCSGLHFLIVGLCLAALYGEIRRDSLGRRAGWLLLMGGLALICNWLRIFAIVVAGYATDMRTFLVTVDHYWFGWLVFLCGFVVFLRLAGRAGSRRSPPAAVPSTAAPLTPSGPSTAVCAAALICMAVLPLIVYVVDWGRGESVSEIAIEWASAQLGWSGPMAGQPTSWNPQFHNATTGGLREYRDANGRSVEIFAVAYRVQRQGVELVAYDNSVLGTDDTVRVIQESIIGSGADAWREARVKDRAGRESIVRWRYTIGERTFVNPLASQLWYGMSSFASRPLSSLFALRAFCEPGCQDARARLDAAAPRLEPVLRMTPPHQKEPST